MMKKMILLAALAVFNSINFVNAQITSIYGTFEVCNNRDYTYTINKNAGTTLKSIKSIMSIFDNSITQVNSMSDVITNNRLIYSFSFPQNYVKVQPAYEYTYTVKDINGKESELISATFYANSPGRVIQFQPSMPQLASISGPASIYCTDEKSVTYKCESSGYNDWSWSYPNGWIKISSSATSATFIPTKGIDGTIGIQVRNTSCNYIWTLPVDNLTAVKRPNENPLPVLKPTSANTGKPVTLSINDVLGANGYSWTTNAPANTFSLTTSSDLKTATFIFNEPSDNNTITVSSLNTPAPCGNGRYTFNIPVYCVDEKLVPECSIKTLTPNYGTAQGFSDINVYPRFMEDVNGDGKADIVAIAASGVVVSLNNGVGSFGSPFIASTSFGVNQGWTNQETYPRTLADMNGDGFKDFVGFAANGVVVALNNKSGKFNAPVLVTSYFGTAIWTNQTSYPRYVKDVNNDGKSDIVGFSAQGVMALISNSNSNSVGFNSLSTSSTLFGNNTGWNNNNVYFRDLVDMNKDDRLDIVGFSATGVVVATFNNLTNKFDLQQGFNSPYFGLNHGFSDMLNYPRFTIDMNKDNYPDLVGFTDGGVFVALNNKNNTFSNPTIWSKGYGKTNLKTSSNSYFSDFNINPRLLGDINGDGYPDIVGFHSNVVCVSLNKGLSGTGFKCAEFKYYLKDFTNAGGWTSQSQFPRFLVDIDGDNRKEIVGFAAGGVVTNNCSSTESSVYFRKDNSTELNTIESIKCYPNPANDVLNFEIPVNEDLVSLLIFDSMGNKIKEVSNTEFANGLFVLNTNTLNAGLYTYQVVINNAVIKSDKVLIIK